MKFSNEKKIGFYKNAYVFLFICLMALWSLNYLIDTQLSSSSFLLATVVLIIAFLYWYQKAKYFEYDSTGLGLVLISRGILVSDYTNYREQRIEIPKTKLHKFKVRKNPISKKLCLYIKSTNGIKKTSVDITLLSNNRIKALEASLHKVIEQNSTR